MSFLNWILMTCFTWSGDEVGNGADAVVCKRDQQVISVTLLDFYEERLRREKESFKSSDAQTVTEIINKLRRVHPQLAQSYKMRSQELLKSARFVSDAGLVNIKDSKHLLKPANSDCEIVQLAVLDKTLPQKPNLLVNESLWKKLDKTNQTGLVLHEVIYEHLSLLGEKDSRKSRRFNAFLFSKEFETISPNDYWKYMKTLRIPIYRR